MKKVVIEDSWYQLLEEEFNKDYFTQLRNRIREAYLKHQIYPEPNNIFSAFNSTPVKKVKVVFW